MAYVDGFVLAVPKANIEAYKRMAKDAGEIWKKHGALDYKECIGDDLTPDMGEYKVATFPQIMNLKDDEVVFFSYILYESRAHRDEVNAKVMADPAMNNSEHKEMPFEMNRMAYGGFEVAVDLFS